VIDGIVPRCSPYDERVKNSDADWPLKIGLALFRVEEKKRSTDEKRTAD
jgi:hypothetical protein